MAIAAAAQLKGDAGEAPPSVRTTERYLGRKRRIGRAGNDCFGIEP